MDQLTYARVIKVLIDLKLCFGDGDALCLPVSILVFRRLQRMGLKPKLIRGFFQTDLPSEYDDEDEANEFTIGKALHYWVELDEHVVDLTAGQFNDEIEGEKMPEIIFWRKKSYPRYSKGKSVKPRLSVKAALKEVCGDREQDLDLTIAELGLKGPI